MPSGDFRDRSLGLVVFGVIEILIGGLTALLIPLVLAVTVAAPLMGVGDSPELRTVLPSLVLYALLAVTFVWIGVGSIRARKWAQAVMLSLSWLWLISGVAAMVAFWWVLPRYAEFAGLDGLPHDTRSMVVLTTSLFVGFVYILLPLGFVLFYRSPSVIATCRARDARPSWVDGCPSPVVSLVLLYAAGAACCLVVPAYNFVFPVFGLVIDGWAGALVWLGIFGLMVYLTVATARRRPGSWAVAMVFSVAAAVSSTISAVLVPGAQWYDRMKLPPDQRQLLDTLGHVSAPTMLLLSVAVWGTWLWYLLWTRRFFSTSVEP